MKIERKQNYESADFKERVRSRAYYDWKTQGSTHGHDVPDYLNAEKVEKELGQEAIKLTNIFDALSRTPVAEIIRGRQSKAENKPELSDEKFNKWYQKELKKEKENPVPQPEVKQEINPTKPENDNIGWQPGDEKQWEQAWTDAYLPGKKTASRFENSEKISSYDKIIEEMENNGSIPRVIKGKTAKNNMFGNGIQEGKSTEDKDKLIFPKSSKRNAKDNKPDNEILMREEIAALKKRISELEKELGEGNPTVPDDEPDQTGPDQNPTAPEGPTEGQSKKPDQIVPSDKPEKEPKSPENAEGEQKKPKTEAEKAKEQAKLIEDLVSAEVKKQVDVIKADYEKKLKDAEDKAAREKKDLETKLEAAKKEAQDEKKFQAEITCRKGPFEALRIMFRRHPKEKANDPVVRAQKYLRKQYWTRFGFATAGIAATFGTWAGMQAAGYFLPWNVPITTVNNFLNGVPIK